MLRVVFFDLGMTLIDAVHRPFPNVLTALPKIQALEADDGGRLATCLVSDVEQSPQAFDDYLAILEAADLRALFEPVQKRVTLSVHAGAFKPDAAIFQKALERLTINVPFEECLLITEKEEHISAVGETLGMQTLLFGAAGPGAFSDWSDAPPRIAAMARGIVLDALDPADGAGMRFAKGHVWERVSIPDFDDLKDIHIRLPIEARVRHTMAGASYEVQIERPSKEALAEAVSYVHGLAMRGAIENHGRATVGTGRKTHAIATDGRGEKKLVRRGFWGR